MNNTAPIHSGNINSKVMTTNEKVKYTEKPELQWNELKSELTVSNKLNKNRNKYKVMIANG